MKIDPDFVELGEEKLVFNSAHTLSLVDDGSHWLAYQGNVQFEGIAIFRNPKDQWDHWRYTEPIAYYQGLRWGSAIRAEGKIYLFCTKQVGQIYHSHDIYLFKCEKGSKLMAIGRVTNGSTPFILDDEGTFRLFFHRRTGGDLDTHTLWVISSDTINGLMTTKPVKILEWVNKTISAPSVAKFHGYYWMTTEVLKEDRIWRTALFKGKTLDQLELIGHTSDTETWLFYNAACCFQHVIGDRYLLTYSSPNWDVFVREGKI